MGGGGGEMLGTPGPNWPSLAAPQPRCAELARPGGCGAARIAAALGGVARTRARRRGVGQRRRAFRVPSLEPAILVERAPSRACQGNRGT